MSCLAKCGRSLTVTKLKPTTYNLLVGLIGRVCFEVDIEIIPRGGTF